MFCRYCGNNIEGDSVFCEVCGKRLREEPINQAPVNQQPVYQQTINQEPVCYSNPTPAYNAPQAYEAPVAQLTQNNYSAKYERITGYSGSLANEKSAPAQSTAQYNPEPSPQVEYKSPTEAPSKKRKSKNKVLPFIMLPIAVAISTLVSFGTSTLWAMLQAYIYDYFDIYSSENPMMFTYIFSFLSNVIGILPPLIIMVLFSLCCKGINKKVRFIGSCYAAGVARIVGSVVNAIIICIINSTVGFYDIDSYTTYTLISAACSLLINIIVLPMVALLWFAASEKYIVKKEIKTRPVKLILPCVFLGIYGLFCLAMHFINQSTYSLLYELFGEYNMFGDYGLPISSSFSGVITTGVCLICLFLLALACKGGYRKLAFVGSVYFVSNITNAIPSLVTIPFAIDRSITTQALGSIIGVCVQYLLIIGLSILIYLLLNRYQVEKIKKKAE